MSQPATAQILPRVAVLMAAYNAEKTIQSAVQSVLASVIPLDLYIIDDGSRVPVADCFSGLPDNVYIHRLPQNGGLPAALNAGLKIVLEKDYEFVARFDADDFCYPERFQVQTAYLDAHKDVQAVGCWVNACGENPAEPLFTIRHPEHHEDIVRAMYYNAAFVHPALMFRAQALRSLDMHYDTAYRLAQDYEFMARFVRRFRTANVPQVLIDYSYLSEISSGKKRRRQLNYRLKIQLRHFTPANIHSWLGVAKTGCLTVIPMGFTTRIKELVHGTEK